MKLLSRALLLSLSITLAAPLSHAQEAASALEGSASATSEVKLSSSDRVKKLVKVAGEAVMELSHMPENSEYMQRFQTRMDALIDKAQKHHLPLPSGISVGFDADAGFGLGGDVGTEFLFLMQEDGTVGFGIFPFIDAEIGAGAILSKGLFIDLVFNLNKVEDYKGFAIGITGDLGFVKNGSAEIAIGVDSEDLKSIKDARKHILAKGNKDSAFDILKTAATKTRSYVIGFGMGVGLGSKFMGYGGYWSQFGVTHQIPLDVNAIHAAVRAAKIEAKGAKRAELKAIVLQEKIKLSNKIRESRAGKEEAKIVAKIKADHQVRLEKEKRTLRKIESSFTEAALD